jgi:hypothetical protein
VFFHLTVHPTFLDSAWNSPHCLGRNGPVSWTHRPTTGSYTLTTCREEFVIEFTSSRKESIPNYYSSCYEKHEQRPNAARLRAVTSGTHAKLHYSPTDTSTKTEIFHVETSDTIMRVFTVGRTTKYRNLNTGLYIPLRIFTKRKIIHNWSSNSIFIIKFQFVLHVSALFSTFLKYYNLKHIEEKYYGKINMS